eukprot:Em0017g130a
MVHCLNKKQVQEKRVAAAAKVTDTPSTIKITCDNAPPRTDDPPLMTNYLAACALDEAGNGINAMKKLGVDAQRCGGHRMNTAYSLCENQEYEILEQQLLSEGVLDIMELAETDLSEFDPCSCPAAIDLSRILQAQESRPGTTASCMLEMSYLVEVLKDDQVDCPVEPPIGAVQHKLTFIPIPKEDLYECVQTIHTVLLLEINRLNLVTLTTKYSFVIVPPIVVNGASLAYVLAHYRLLGHRFTLATRIDDDDQRRAVFLLLRAFHFSSSQQADGQNPCRTLWPEGENVAQFVAELRRIAQHCEFGPALDDMLRDRLVCGLRDDKVQRRLLADSQLTFAKAFEVAQASELAEQRAATSCDWRQLHPRAYGARRWRSTRVEHAAKGQPISLGVLPSKKSCARMSTSASETAVSDAEVDILACRAGAKDGFVIHVVHTLLYVKDRPHPLLLITMCFNEAKLRMEVDTGAAVSLIMCGDGPLLLGRDSFSTLTLNLEELSVLHTRNVDGLKVKLHVKDSCKPRYYKARPVPYALREKVEAELVMLEKSGVIKKAQFSEWAAPAVPVLKRDSSICLCGDYKLTINRAAVVDAYPLPRI